MNETLDAIGLKYGTDKSSAYHNYLVRLEPYFASLPRPLRLLEVGVCQGRSIRVWLDYFPDSEIEGIDFVPGPEISNPRYTFHLGNAEDERLWESLGKFHVIIDDGSHWSQHVKAAYDFGFNHLLPGGLWIIEDTCKSDYDPLELMRPTVAELQDHNGDYSGNPNNGASRFAFVHFLKGLVIIGRR